MLGHGILQVRLGNVSPEYIHELTHSTKRPFATISCRYRVVLPFCGIEIILSCFQTGRMYEWARAHFFVGRDKWRSAEASLLEVPAYEVLAAHCADGVRMERGCRTSGTGTPRLAARYKMIAPD